MYTAVMRDPVIRENVMYIMVIQVMVASGQKNLMEQRMRVCTLLWDAGIKVT